MGSSGQSREMAWSIKKPVCRVEFIGACIIFGCSCVGFICCVIGIDVVPKCRYGSPECYFSVKVCPYNAQSPRIGPVTLQGDDSCRAMLKSRAVEGSSAWSGEQFALPIFCSVLGIIPGILTMVGVLFDKALGLMESGKVFISINITMLLMSIRIVQNLTFDCRWWADRHHGNHDECHDGLELFVAGAVLLVSCQMALLAISVMFTEKERWNMITKDHPESFGLHRLDALDASM